MGKGGGGGHTPVEAPESGRSKQQVKIVEIISEGEIKGLVNGVKSVFLDNTPIQAENDAYNFNNVFAEGRIGSQDQDVMSGFNTSEKEINVGVQVKNGLPIVRTITDDKVSRLRFTLGVQALSSVNDQGDTNPTSVQFRITIGNKAPTLHIIDGKYSSQYLRAFTFNDLPDVPFTIKVERLTSDSNTNRLQNNTIWASYTEIIDTEFAYPNTALVGIKFDSEQFGNIPTRTYEIYGIKVQVPSNYNPETRTYNGMWDGTFKVEWSDNPLWVLYDHLINNRYGLGRKLSASEIDIWAFYSAAKYCDELIPNGFGGAEPRFTCNLWTTEQRAAYDVINDLCSIFRAMPVWNGQMFTIVMDRPTDPVYTYTNANVVEGEFTYTYSALKARHNAIQVEYLDANNSYEPTLEYISDDEAIRKYGLNLLKIKAFGCTSRGQAYRHGKWILETERLETKTATFSVGAEGLMNIPGDIIRVADNNYAGTELGGRVTAINGKTVTLDREIELVSNCYLTYINKEAKHKDIKILGVVNGTQVSLESEPVGLSVNDVWSLTSQDVSVQLFKCLSIAEDEKGKYTITALQHEPQKEAIVDNSAVFEQLTTSLYRGPARVSHSSVTATENGIELNWEQPLTDGTVTYEVKLYKDGKFYRLYSNLKTPRLTFEGLPNGIYTVEIRSKNQYGQYSSPVIKTFEINLSVKNLKTLSQLFAIEIQWELPELSTIGNSTEIWHSTTDSLSSATKLVTLPYPTTSYVMGNIGLTEKHYFWARLVDKNGNKGEFTDGVFGECDHNPNKLVSYLEGQITRSQLGEELIRTLKADIDNAVDEEAKIRQAAVANAIAQITAQAQSTGTAINELRNTDSQQAEQILTITAKAENALSGIQAEQKARADGDKANADKITAITARMGTAESTIANLQSTKASKTEVSSIAQQTVTAAMGDTKAQVSALSNAVTDANNKLKATHTIKTQAIAGGRTAIAGIAMGATADGVTTESSVIVMADKFGIVANANDGNVKPVFSVVNNQVGIRGDLVVAGTVTNDKLSSGLGGNLLQNPIFANDGYGWSYSSKTAKDSININKIFRYNKGDNRAFQNIDGLPNEAINISTFSTRPADNDWFNIAWCRVSVNKHSWYMLSAYVDFYNCRGSIVVDSNNENGSTQLARTPLITRGNTFGFRDGISSAPRHFIKFKAPESGVITIIFRVYEYFGDSGDAWVARPMLEECTEHSTEPSPWVNAGVTQVHGGSIIANTIRGEHIQANQTLTSPVINGGTITGNTINGTTINGSTISGSTVKGGRIEGGVISGTTILGDIVKAVILTRNGNNFEGTVPASEVSSRTVVIPSFSFKANPGETSTLAIYIDGVKVSDASVTGTHKQVMASGVTPATTVRGTVSVSVSGDASGNLSGNVSGNVNGNVGGAVNGGYVSGSVSGTVSGTASGRASGRVTGSARGTAEGSIPATTITTSFWLDIPSFGSISGYKQITGKSVAIRVTANNANALSGQNSLVALVA